MKKYILTILIIFIINNLTAQETDYGFSISSRIAPLEFEKVDENVFSIPIYDIKIGELVIPISVNYNASGIKAFDEPSYLGLKWNLSYGPVINRHVNSIPDDQPPIDFTQLPDINCFNLNPPEYYEGCYGSEGSWGGWLLRTLPADHELSDYTYLFIPTTSPSPFHVAHTTLHNVHDMQPDEFTLILGNSDYNYLINTDGSIKYKKYNGIEISHNLMDENEFPFIVKDLNGTVYNFIKGNEHFRQNRSNASQCNDPDLVPNEVFPGYCDKFVIESIDLKSDRSVSFVYNDDLLDERLRYGVGYSSVEDGNSYFKRTCYQSVTKLLETIITPKETISFEYETYTDPRYQDRYQSFYLSYVSDFQRKLKKILVYDNNGLFKKGFEFFYDTDNDFRLRLLEIFLYVDEDTKQLYRKFIYNNYEVTFPDAFTKQDFFGYYNDNDEDHLFPYIWDGTSNADRTYDEQKIKSGILSQIIYPTGGKVGIDYSPNAYYDEQYDDDLYGGGVHPSKLYYYDSDNTFISSINYSLTKLAGYVENQQYNESLYHTSWLEGFHPWVYYDHDIYSTKPLHVYSDQGIQVGGDFDYYHKGFYFREKVIERQDEFGNSNGNIEQEYKHSFLGHRKTGVLNSEKIYNSDGILKKQINYHYNYSEIVEDELDFIEGIYLDEVRSHNILGGECSWFPDVYTYVLYPRKFYYGIDFKLFKKEEREFLDGQEILKTQQYQYNSKNQIFTITNNTSTGDDIQEEFLYLSDLDFIPASHYYNDLLNDNFDNKYLENYWLIKSDEKYLLRSKVFIFNDKGQKIEVYKAEIENPLSEDSYTYPYFEASGNFLIDLNIYSRFSNIKYDNYDNVIEVLVNNQNYISYIWGNNYSEIVAKIENVEYDIAINKIDEIFSYSIEDIQGLNNDELKNIFQSLRNEFPNAMINSFTYNLLYGIESKIEPNGKETYYSYDDFGRLESTYDDENGNIIKHVDYNFSDYYVNFLLSASPNSFNLNFNAGTAQVNVTSNTNWNVYEDSEWLTITSPQGNGNGNFTFTYNENQELYDRSSNIYISAFGIQEVVTVNQDAPDYLFAQPTALNFNFVGQPSQPVQITSNVSWNVSVNNSWISVSPTSGQNNGSINVQCETNPGPPRDGTVTISGGNGVNSVTIAVHQDEH